MSNEIIINTGLCYPDDDAYGYVMKNDAGVMKVHKGSDTWEVFDEDNVANYIVSAPQGENGLCFASFPAAITTPGRYLICGLRYAAGVVIQYLEGGYWITWDGSKEIFADEKLLLAAKAIVNKITQNKISNVMKIYDDDGETLLRTLTPDDDGEDITITPS